MAVNDTKNLFGGVNLLHLRVSYLMLAVSLFLFYKKRTIWKEHFNRYKYFYLTWIFTFIPVFGSGATGNKSDILYGIHRYDNRYKLTYKHS